MNASKMILCAIGATLVISVATYGASARTVDGIGSTGSTASEMRTVRPEIGGEHAAIGNGSSILGVQIALNPQPLPPGRADDGYYDDYE